MTIWILIDIKISIINTKGGKDYLHKIRRKEAGWIGHILCWNFFLKHVLERMIEETGKGPRRRKQTLDDFNETLRYWKLKEDILDCTV
jgi:hypothetical protein